MKYYIYISDTKVDMLYPQIPQPLLKRIASNLSIDLKLFGAEVNIGAKSGSSEETRISKVRIVSEYIEKHKDVGSIDAPSTYCKGTLPMRWGPIGGQTIYFSGSSTRTSIGLGGSLKHVIGAHAESPERRLSSSDMGSILETLEEALEHYESHKEINTSLSEYERVFDAILTVRAYTTGLKQQVEFLAKTLLQGQSSYKYVVLGTPIYVAI